MSNLLRFEGHTQEEARCRIREALGSDARIVRAGKERSGGILGFFQHEIFVFEVERPESSPATNHEPVSDPPLAPSLAAAIDHSQSTLTLSNSVSPPNFATSFKEVLSEAEATIAAADTPTTTPISNVALHPPSPDAGCYHRPSSSLIQDSDHQHPASLTAEVTEPANHDNTVHILDGSSLTAGPPLESPPSGGGPSLPRHDWSSLVEALCLPRDARALPQILEAIDTLAKPPALPCDDRSLVLVIGRRGRAYRLAEKLASSLGDPAERLVCTKLGQDRSDSSKNLATSSGRSLGPLAISQLVATRRVQGHATVLAVAIPKDTGPTRIAELVTALRPDACWAALSSEDAASELAKLRKAVERLDAVTLDHFTTYANALELFRAEVPIAYVDGHRASPIMLAALLIELFEGTSL